MTSLIGKIDPFDFSGESWTCYMERLDQYFIINDVADDKRVPALLALVGSKTYSTLRDLTSPALPKDKSYAELTTLLSSHFNPAPLVIAERFRFWKRDQRADESISDFNVNLRKLSQHCKFGEGLNDALRDRLVCGLTNVNIQKRLLSEKDLTYERVLQLSISMECAQKDIKELHQTAGGAASMHKVASSFNKKPVQIKKDLVQRECYRCNRKNHTPDACRFKDAIGNFCGKKGHISPACRTNKFDNVSKKQKGHKSKNKKGQVHGIEEDDLDLGHCLFQMDHDDQGNYKKVIWVTPTVNGQILKMELDTGSGVSVISKEDCFRLWPSAELEKTDIQLKTYSGEVLKPVGCMKCTVEQNWQCEMLNLYVVEHGSRPLFGREWLRRLQLNWHEIKSLNSEVNSIDVNEKVKNLKSKYANVFKSSLGKVTGYKATLKLKPNSNPKFIRARTVAFAVKPKIEAELERLVSEGVEKVTHSEWATPIVPVPKSNVDIRICGDFKVTINPVLEVDQHPLPQIEHIFASLGKGKKFSKIVLKNAYLQLEVDDESKKLLKISIHKGLFRYNRLVFGVASAPAIFQRLIEQIMEDIPNVQVILDDMIITGSDDKEHLEILEQVLKRLDEYGLRVNVEKCKFMEPKVEFCGHEIDADGLHKTDAKIAAIVNAPEIKNVKDLRSFLGLVQYYAKFLENLSTILHPLHQLLQKNARWKWTSDCDKAVQTVKKMITSDLVLVNYDPDLPVILACDASSFGLGAVLSHRLPNGTERPIAFASRSLSSARETIVK
ncbi:uncharacterized protein K02A2.6-like [Ruditapes philippinarum]|uniref:uncharacterized protein K02A2.6-like n=1 Tax=Ruditapes philippinarum TaxID=129788 RepID=UPI00295A9FD9|nr:uncharacterized protein K02A2.6-like [Ruditapes philippinarum]